MLPRNHPDRIQITFDDHRLVANAGLLLPATLARHLGLPELVRQRLDLGDAPGRANTSDKMMTLVASALAGGDCIDDADVLRTGGTACALGGTVKAPSTLGTFLRSFRWGQVRQLDRVSRELLARAWQAGAGPGDGPLTIDLDSTICETYGLAKEGARHHGYTGKRGYHPLLAVAADTGDVLMARLREGRPNTARAAAHFLRETVSRVRYGGASGQLTMRADSGFYDLSVKDLHIYRLFSLSCPGAKQLRRPIQQLGLPLRDLVRVHIELACQLRKCPVAAHCGKSHLRLELCRVVTAGSSAHLSLLSPRALSCPQSVSDSTYPPVQISGATSMELVNPPSPGDVVDAQRLCPLKCQGKMSSK